MYKDYEEVIHAGASHSGLLVVGQLQTKDRWASVTPTDGKKLNTVITGIWVNT